MDFSDDERRGRFVRALNTFYLQNESGLFLTNDADNRKLSVEEQDFSKNQTWYLSGDTGGKLFCGNGTCLSTQWGIHIVTADEDYDYLKFYFHELKGDKFYIGILEDKDKKFEGDEKQHFLAVTDGEAYMGPIEEALEGSEKASIGKFTWQKVQPDGESTYEWPTMGGSEPFSDLPKYALAAGEENGQEIFVGRVHQPDNIWHHTGVLHGGKVHNGIKYMGFHDEERMKTEAFYLQNESGLYLTNWHTSALTLEKLEFSATQLWYWDNSYDFEKSYRGPHKNVLRCATREVLYMQNEDDPETVVYASESTSDDNRHKFYSHDLEDENILIGKLMEKDGKKEERTFLGFCSQGYFKMGKPSEDSDKHFKTTFKWKKVPANQAYMWSTFSLYGQVPNLENILSFGENGPWVHSDDFYATRAEVNGVIHPGNAQHLNDRRSFGYICDFVNGKKNHCNHCCIRQNCLSVTERKNEKYTGLCVDPEAEVEWINLPDLKDENHAYHCNYRNFPKNAVIGGIISGSVYYMGRGFINDEYQKVPGIFKPKYENTKLIAYHDGKMHELDKFEMLIVRKKDEELLKTVFDKDNEPFNYHFQHFGIDNAVRTVDNENDNLEVLTVSPDADVDWVEYVDEKLPNGAVIAGLSDDGVIPTGIYYVGRGTINKEIIPGIFLNKKTSLRERSEVLEHTLYVIYRGEIHQLKKFQVLVVKKHVQEKSGEKGTTASGGLKEDNWKLIGTDDLPTGFEIVEINEANFSEYAERIRTLTLKAVEDGSIKLAKKMKDHKHEDDSSVVVIVGGFIPYRGSSVASTVSESIEVFDPQRLCDPDFAKLPEGRYSSSVHYLEKTGQILICGGQVQGCVGDETDSVTKSCYALAEGAIKHHSNMLVPRRLHSGAVCSDKLWIFGGQSADIREGPLRTKVSDGDSYSSIESMSISGNVWSKEAIELMEARSDGCAVTIDDENILLIGGVNNYGKNLVMKTQVTKFNTKSFTFTTLAPMLDDDEGITFSNRTEMKGGRQGHGSVFIPARNGGSGHVLVAGGEGKGYVLETAQIYDIDANEWSWAGKLNTKRKMGAMVYVDGRIFFMGGQDNYNKLDSIEEYHPEKKTWTVLDWTLKTTNMEFSATVVPRSILGKPKQKQSSADIDNVAVTLKFESKGDAALHRESRMGNYTKTDQIIKGCPVFEQDLSPPGDKYYLFVGPNGCWRVGPDVTSYSGSVLKNPKKHKKIPPKSGWLYYLNDKWNKDNSLELVEDKEKIEVTDDNEKNKQNEQIKHKEVVKTAFAKADTEGTGKLTRDQLKVALLEIVESGQDVAFIENKNMIDDDDTLKMFIEVADRDGDKLINLNELLYIMELGDEKTDEKEWFTRLVKAADKDGNGLITAEELRYMVVKCGFAEEDEASGCVAMIITMGATDSNKTLKIEEVVNFFTEGQNEENPIEDMKRMFRMFDTNEDGFISKKELIDYIKFMDFVDEDDTPEEVNFMVNMLMVGADEDNDGKLSYEEFCSILS